MDGFVFIKLIFILIVIAIGLLVFKFLAFLFSESDCEKMSYWCRQGKKYYHLCKKYRKRCKAIES